MIDFMNFKAVEGKPIYLQIVDYIKRGCVAGLIVNGDELPSRRYLSALLGINPMTVQKSFRILTDDGLMESRAGSKSVMVLDDERIRDIKKELLEEQIMEMAGALKQMGLEKKEVLELISNYWGVSDDEK